MGLDARIELSINGHRILEIRAHPDTPMDSLATMLEDTAAHIRRDLENTQPVLTIHERPSNIDPAHASPTPPATYCGQHITNLIDSNIDKMILAIELGDNAATEEYFNKVSSLYAWAGENYTPEAIENGPAPSLRKAGE